MQIGNHIREWRAREQLSQTQAAERIGCTQPTISSWEAGKLPDLHSFKKIAQVIGIPLETLLADSADELAPVVREVG